MITKKLTILNKLGLHARAAAKVVSLANEFESTIIITKDGKNADARSIMKLLMLSASQGSRINIEVDGADHNDTEFTTGDQPSVASTARSDGESMGGCLPATES